MPRHRKVNKQKKGNNWYLVYRPPGQSKQVWTSVGRDEVEAERKRLEKQSELLDYDYVEPSRDSFSSLCEEWYSSVVCVRDAYSENTVIDYRSILDHHIMPKFGSQPTNKVRYRQIQSWVKELSDTGLAPNTINNVLSVMSGVFKYGIRAELCRDNPVDKVDRPGRTKEEADCLSPDELWLLLEVVGELQPFYYPLVVTALMTGARLGELRALEWRFVDLDRAEMRIRASQSRQKTKNPKTDAGWRTVPLPPMVLDVLTAQSEARIAGCELVFPSHRLTPIDPANLRKRVLHKALDAAGLRRVTWHSLRHSAASLMIRSGGNPKQVQTLLGHSSLSVTMDLYSHVFADEKHETMNRMGEFFDTKRPDRVKEDCLAYNSREMTLRLAFPHAA
ncbi:MAG: tyrosine-type recombinase/integrase [Coriobacteriia bacterium]